MDVLHVVADVCLIYQPCSAAKNEIASRAMLDFLSEIGSNGVLSIVPSDIDLMMVSNIATTNRVVDLHAWC